MSSLSSCRFFFFFCKQKTAYERLISGWSSDVCSSDLVPGSDQGLTVGLRERRAPPSEKARQRRAFSFVVAVATVIAVALPLPRITGLPRPGAPPRCA